MLQNNRIIFKKSGELIDLSIPLSSYLAKSPQAFDYVSGDALFIGSDLPFNHRWFELGDVNDELAKIKIELWNGNRWIEAVDVIDQTAVDGKTFAQSGIVSFTPDRYHSWFPQISTEQIPDLNTLKIYDLFWAKITFTHPLGSDTSLSYMGHKFSSDTDLFARYANLANIDLITAFADEKEDWNDQHFIAAEELIQHLRANRVIISPNQILRFEQFKVPAIHKCAEVIYRSFGEDYADEMKNAAAEFMKAMQIGSQNIDRNANASLEFFEKSSSTEFLDR